jgi:uncharacterized protein (DUF111 family)
METETVQIKVKMSLINEIRNIKPEFKEIPATYIVDMALRHFRDELKKESEAS